MYDVSMDALSAQLRDEWRRQVGIFQARCESIEHETEPASDNLRTDLDAIEADLRLIAPSSPDTAPPDWPGGWVLRAQHLDLPGSDKRTAWQTREEAEAAAIEAQVKVDERVATEMTMWEIPEDAARAANKVRSEYAFTVQWAPFARRHGRNLIVLDRHHWDTPGGGTEWGS